MTMFLTGLVVFITHALEAITGFGCTVLAMPFVTTLLGMKQGVIVLTILAWILALYIVITKYKNINLKQFGIIVIFVGAGLPIGMLLFRVCDSDTLKKIVSLFIILTASWQLFRFWHPVTGYIVEKKKTAWYLYVLLFLGGIVHGMFSSGGLLVVLYASKKLPKKGEFRATLCFLWGTLNTVLMAGYYFLPDKNLVQTSLKTTGFMLPFLVAGIIAGELLHTKVSQRIFMLIVFIMLLVTGIFMLVL